MEEDLPRKKMTRTKQTTKSPYTIVQSKMRDEESPPGMSNWKSHGWISQQ